MVKQKELREERRRYPRITGIFDVEIAHQKSRLITDTINVSASGIYCQCNNPIPLFREIGVNLKIPGTGKVIDCSGVVVRSEKIPKSSRYSIAIFFIGMLPEEKKFLADYIDKLISKEK